MLSCFCNHFSEEVGPSWSCLTCAVCGLQVGGEGVVSVLVPQLCEDSAVCPVPEAQTWATKITTCPYYFALWCFLFFLSHLSRLSLPFFVVQLCILKYICYISPRISKSFIFETFKVCHVARNRSPTLYFLFLKSYFKKLKQLKATRCYFKYILTFTQKWKFFNLFHEYLCVRHCPKNLG